MLLFSVNATISVNNLPEFTYKRARNPKEFSDLYKKCIHEFAPVLSYTLTLESSVIHDRQNGFCSRYKLCTPIASLCCGRSLTYFHGSCSFEPSSIMRLGLNLWNSMRTCVFSEMPNLQIFKCSINELSLFSLYWSVVLPFLKDTVTLRNYGKK